MLRPTNGNAQCGCVVVRSVVGGVNAGDILTYFFFFCLFWLQRTADTPPGALVVFEWRLQKQLWKVKELKFKLLRGGDGESTHSRVGGEFWNREGLLIGQPQPSLKPWRSRDIFRRRSRILTASARRRETTERLSMIIILTVSLNFSHDGAFSPAETNSWSGGFIADTHSQLKLLI